MVDHLCVENVFDGLRILLVLGHAVTDHVFNLLHRHGHLEFLLHEVALPAFPADRKLHVLFVNLPLHVVEVSPVLGQFTPEPH